MSKDEMPPIPEFLLRPLDGVTEEEYKRNQAAIIKEEKLRRDHPGKFIKMPQTRVDPRRTENAAKKREMPVKGEKSKKVKIQHPSTEAIKEATKGLVGDDKLNALYAIARENDINPGKWDHLNLGQVAMNLSNVLRGRYYKMQDVYVNGVMVT